MTNKEILEADMLDILFEHRNKAYGAYSLRRHYNNRLFIALSIALSAVVMIYLLSLLKQNMKAGDVFPGMDDRTVILTSVEVIPPKMPDPPAVKKPQTAAEVKNVTIRIVPNDPADDIPAQDVIATNIISTQTVDGIIPEDRNAHSGQNTDKEDDGKLTTKPGPDFNPVETPPRFPGGPSALALFFSNTLSSPTDLEAGERKVVLVRFVVGADGSITKAEIMQSGGDMYDREVLRAFKRMPHWIPAVQNGNKIAVSFTQPVTFVGVEQ